MGRRDRPAEQRHRRARRQPASEDRPALRDPDHHHPARGGLPRRSRATVNRARTGSRVGARTVTGAGRRISRIPLRRRLVAGLAATMLVLLTAAGAFVYWRGQFALDRSLNGSLDDAAVELSPLVTASGRLPADSATLARVDGFQILTPAGKVLGHDTRLGEDPVLSEVLLRRALTSPVRANTGDFLPAARRPLRLYATPVHVNGSPRRLVLVIAAPRAQRD